MIKKILIYLSISTGFIFCFLFGKYINTLAVTNIDNTLGSYPIQMDINNYKFKSDNLLGVETNVNVLNSLVFSYRNESDNNFWQISADTCTSTCYADIYFPNFESGSYIYKASLFSSINTTSLIIVAYVQNNGVYITPISTRAYNIQNQTLDISIPFTYDESNGKLGILLYYKAAWYNSESINEYGYKTLSNQMIYDSSLNLTEFEPYYNYGFGFQVDLILNEFNTNYTSLNVDMKINNETCYNMTSTFLPEDNYYRLKNLCFIPFNVDNNGLVSLEETILNATFTSSNITEINGISGFVLVPYLKGYYKGELIENIIYLKNNYIANSFYLNGFTARVYGNDDERITSVVIDPFTDNESSDNDWGLTKQNQSFNFITENVVDVKYFDSININNFLNYNLGLTFGQFTSLSDISTLNYAFSLSGINSIIINDSSATSPLPDNELTTDKYNTCSAWYDIPCQLGNAITYVIYEAPIISPIVEFITTFIEGLQYVITYIKWFEGLGIVFSLFIFILMIRLLIMLIKGSNDDRGGNK